MFSGLVQHVGVPHVRFKPEHFMPLSSAESVKTDICLTGRMLIKFPYITSVCVTHVKKAQLFALLKDVLSNLCIISASSLESGAHEPKRVPVFYKLQIVSFQMVSRICISLLQVLSYRQLDLGM
jgi:hypothetical protein